MEGRGRGWWSVPERDKEGKQTCRQREVLLLPSLWGYRTRREWSRKGVRPGEGGERVLRFYRTGCWQSSLFHVLCHNRLVEAQLSHSEHTTRLWKWTCLCTSCLSVHDEICWRSLGLISKTAPEIKIAVLAIPSCYEHWYDLHDGPMIMMSRAIYCMPLHRARSCAKLAYQQENMVRLFICLLGPHSLGGTSNPKWLELIHLEVVQGYGYVLFRRSVLLMLECVASSHCPRTRFPLCSLYLASSVSYCEVYLDLVWVWHTSNATGCRVIQ